MLVKCLITNSISKRVEKCLSTHSFKLVKCWDTNYNSHFPRFWFIRSLLKLHWFPKQIEVEPFKYKQSYVTNFKLWILHFLAWVKGWNSYWIVSSNLLQTSERVKRVWFQSVLLFLLSINLKLGISLVLYRSIHLLAIGNLFFTIDVCAKQWSLTR